MAESLILIKGDFGMLPMLRISILLAAFLVACATLPSSTTGSEKDTIDRALDAVALKRSDLRIRPDLYAAPFVLPSFLHWMQNPLNAPREVMEKGQRLFEDSQDFSAWALRVAGLGQIMDLSPLTLRKCPEPERMDQVHAEALNKALLHLMDAIYTANEWLASQRKAVPPDRMRLIEQYLYPECVKGEDMEEEPNETIRVKQVREALKVAGSVERKAMMDAALTLLDATKKAVELVTGPGMGDIRSFSLETPIGLVEVGGKGRDVHSRDASLIVDLGGDDIYLGRAASGSNGRCAIVIDLEGDDLYLGEDFTQGSGLWGIGILLDVRGNDTYKAGNCAQGSGLFGVGLLIDAEGNDRYAGGRMVQAASAWGVGGLLDLSGEDVYQCESCGQAFSGVLGVSCLCELDGSDRFLSGLNAPDPREPDMNQSFSQGFSMGMRNLAAGGIALLADRTGNDLYQCEYFGQGGSYWMGVGLLYDHQGNDTYAARRYAQGAGIHYSFGMLMDAGGDDRTSSWGVSQGCGHDYGIGVLVNQSGNDAYLSDWLSMGASDANGIGIFLDTGGDDGYDVRRSGMGTGHLTSSRRAGGTGLFVDGGGKDRYSSLGGDNTIWSENRWGIGIDENEGALNLDLPTVAVPLGDGGPAREKRARERVRLMRILQEAESLPGPERVERLLSAASYWGLEEEASRRAQEELLQMDPTISLPVVAEFLDTPEVLILIFMEKLFSVHAFFAAPVLMEKANAHDTIVKSMALYLLSKIGDPSAIGCSRAYLHDPDWRMRAAAVRAIGELLNTDRYEKLLLLRKALEKTQEIEDLQPLKESFSEKTSPLILSVLASSVPLQSKEYEELDGKVPPPAFIDFVSQHKKQMRRLLDRWIGEITASNVSATEIRACLSDPDPAVKRAAVYALGQMHCLPALRDIMFTLSDPDPWVRDSAVLSLALFGDDALPILQEAMETRSRDVLLLSLDALERIHSEAARELILGYAHHPDEIVRRTANQVISRF